MGPYLDTQMGQAALGAGLGIFSPPPNIFGAVQPNISTPFVDPTATGDFGAQETLSRLYEAEFQDYLTRFFPVEQRLISEMQEGFPEQQQAEINRAQSVAASTFANFRGQEQRRQAGYGMNVGQTANNSLDRTETSSIVAAKNFARMRSEERRMQILSGGLGSITQQRTAV